jgi:anaerobic selenocysteine-containing dehydrogenase
MPQSDGPERVYAVCPHDCPSTCALEVERLDSRRIGRVHGDPDHPYTAGVVCAKVARYAERIHHPERLTKPLLRRGDKGVGREAFVEISWNEALQRSAEAFKEAAKRDGSEAVWPYYFAGTMGHVQRDGINRLRHVMRYSRQHTTICTTLAEAGWNAAVGAKAGVDPREVAESDLIVVWGGNPVSTQVNFMTHVSRARKARGARLVVIDPYRSPTVATADLHLAPKPGTDGALAAAVVHVLLRDGLTDRDFLTSRSDWDGDLEAHFQTTSPTWASKITGLAVQEIEDFARLYGAHKRSYIRVGYGMSRSRNGAASVHAVACLPTVSGAWRYPGGGALWGNGAIYHLDKTLIEGLDALDPEIRLLDQSRIGPVLVGDPKDIGDGPPVTALLIQNMNPVAVCPETRKVIAGFARDDLFACVHEQFMTETAAMADIVLPATMSFEHDDYYTASGHTFLQVSRAILEPPGECRSNHEVNSALAKLLGAEHPGFEMTAFELIEATFAASGHGRAKTAWLDHGFDCAEDFESMHFLKGFAHADKKFHFYPGWPEPLSPLPGFSDVIDGEDEEHPFRLVAAPARSFLNTSFTETPSSRKREAAPSLMIHPKALARIGAEEGSRLKMGNRQGSIIVPAKAFDGLQENVVVVESIWPNAAFEGGLGINTLISADAGHPLGGAVFHDTAVWIRTA